VIFQTLFSNAIENYEDAYYGYYDTFSDFVREHFEECNEIPQHLEFYIDYEKVERDYQHDFLFHNGYVFNNH
jgi:antirestriction protein